MHPPLQPGSYELVISEARVWAEVEAAPPTLRQSRVDFVLCTRQQASDGAFHEALHIYIDGQQHFPWHEEGKASGRSASSRWQAARATRETDRTISSAAADLGYTVVRVCFADVREFLQIVKAAWEIRSQGGALVSRSWNSGAHLEWRFVAGGAGHFGKVDGAQACASG
jgi:hypothetical protein